MNHTLVGAIGFGSAIAGLFFFRFWWRSRDRFFLYFAVSFWLEAGIRVVQALLGEGNELAPWVYSVRVLAHGLIVLAIIQKNRGGQSTGAAPPE